MAKAAWDPQSEFVSCEDALGSETDLQEEGALVGRRGMQSLYSSA